MWMVVESCSGSDTPDLHSRFMSTHPTHETRITELKALVCTDTSSWWGSSLKCCAQLPAAKDERVRSPLRCVCRRRIFVHVDLCVQAHSILT